MGKAKKTRKYAVMKKQISPKDPRLYVQGREEGGREGGREGERGGEVEFWSGGFTVVLFRIGWIEWTD
jgi:hypothetical protein